MKILTCRICGKSGGVFLTNPNNDYTMHWGGKVNCPHHGVVTLFLLERIVKDQYVVFGGFTESPKLNRTLERVYGSPSLLFIKGGLNEGWR